MSLDSLPLLVTLLIALSVAAERVVEITKSLVPWLDTRRDDTRGESYRRATLQALAVGAGILIAWLSWPVIGDALGPAPAGAERNRGLTVLVLGLLASGGSGFWNTILGYTGSLKDLRRTEVRERKAQARVALVPTPDEGQVTP